MLTSERKAFILDRLAREGRVVAKLVSRELSLSDDTIRRDLRELAEDGLLQRVHGGALPISPALMDFAGREDLSVAGKAAIGRTAARLIRSGQVVILDGGTTSVQLARHLPPELEATVVTHSPNVAVELARHPRITIELIGGRLFKHSIVTVGAVAADAISRLRADLYFMGVTGVHADQGLTTGDREEAAIKQSLSRRAGETIVLASREKLGAVSPFLVARLADVDAIVVEGDVPDDMIAPYRSAGPILIAT